jgi:hypothetical protein
MTAWTNKTWAWFGTVFIYNSFEKDNESFGPFIGYRYCCDVNSFLNFSKIDHFDLVHFKIVLKSNENIFQPQIPICLACTAI